MWGPNCSRRAVSSYWTSASVTGSSSSFSSHSNSRLWNSKKTGRSNDRRPCCSCFPRSISPYSYSGLHTLPSRYSNCSYTGRASRSCSTNQTRSCYAPNSRPMRRKFRQSRNPSCMPRCHPYYGYHSPGHSLGSRGARTNIFRRRRSSQTNRIPSSRSGCPHCSCAAHLAS